MIDRDYCTFYIVRHGETDWNVARRIMGRTVNAKGEMQAHELERDLESISFDGVVSSDLLRAKRTAEIIASKRGLTVVTSSALRERGFGDMEGKPVEVVQKLDETIEDLPVEQQRSHKFDPNYESDNEVVARVIPFLKNTAIQNLGKSFLVVAHGGVMRASIDFMVGGYNPKRHVGNIAHLVVVCDGTQFKINEAKGIEL